MGVEMLRFGLSSMAQVAAMDGCREGIETRRVWVKPTMGNMGARSGVLIMKMCKKMKEKMMKMCTIVVSPS